MGRPKLQFCSRGHDTFIVGRYTDSSCKMCRNNLTKQWQENNPEKVRAIDKAYYNRHKEQERINGRLYWRQKQEKKLLLAGRPKPNLCDICQENGRIVWDHDHKTGKFRGWLCDRCNKTLGLIKDNPDLLSKLIIYLKPNL